MRWLVVALLLVTSVVRATPDGPAAPVGSVTGARTTPIGFDHTLHERDVLVSGAESLPCARCHVLQGGRLVGRPTHAACFGACHSNPPKAPPPGKKLVLDPDRLKLCTNCHAESVLVAPYSGKLPVAYPPYTIDQDFNLSLGHKQHREFACTQCHDTSGKRGPAHQRCLGCHDGSGSPGHGPAMTKCSGCHPPAVGKPQPPELAALQNSVSSAFSHAKHAGRGGAGKDCLTCHAPIRDTDDSELPRPKVADCATCHNGKAAFGTLIACTRCHDKAVDKFQVERPEARFSHKGPHAELVAKQACGSCHVLAKSGEVSIGGHTLCTGCHAQDFTERHPTKCGACHNATEPWRHLVADRSPPDTTEFGANLDHGKHATECTSCHALDTRTTQLRTPRGHVACTSGKPGACHAVDSGPPPQLGACTSCHRLDLAAERGARRIADTWSVRLTFDHRPHRTAADGSAVACSSCHVDVKAKDVIDLPAPPKQQCAPCHDGKKAFKLTGTQCRLCHPKARS
jgi:c(7)-type cytochrome triheme protein